MTKLYKFFSLVLLLLSAAPVIADYWELISPLFKVILYNVLLITVYFFRLWSDNQKNHQNISLLFKQSMPTTAGIVRIVAVVLLSFSFYSSNFRDYPVVLYYIYIYSSILFFNTYIYHLQTYRTIRILLDLVFATMIFYEFDGLRNISWLLFLIPISTVARYYASKNIFAIVGISTIIVIVFTVFIGTRNTIPLQVCEILQNLGPNFGDYLNGSTTQMNWLTAKQLMQAIFFFHFIAIVFRVENKSKVQRLIRFVDSIYRYCNLNGKSVNERLISEVCIAVNTEFVIARNDEYLFLAFQTAHTEGTSLDRCNVHKFKLTEAQVIQFNKFDAKVELYKSEYLSAVDMAGKLRRWLIDKNDALITESELIAQFSIETDKGIIKDFNRLSSSLSLDKYREDTGLLPSLEIISIVPFKVNKSLVIAVNNLPTKYRRLQRRFWIEELQKLAICKYLFES